MHFTKCFKEWHDHWTGYIKSKGENFDNYNIDSKVSFVVTEKVVQSRKTLIPGVLDTLFCLCTVKNILKISTLKPLSVIPICTISLKNCSFLMVPKNSEYEQSTIILDASFFLKKYFYTGIKSLFVIFVGWRARCKIFIFLFHFFIFLTHLLVSGYFPSCSEMLSRCFTIIKWLLMLERIQA
jgi:hypothetical protein